MKNLAKIIFIALEVVCIYGVGMIAYLTSDWMISTMIVCFTMLAIILQAEQQRIKWEKDTEDEKIKSQIEMWIDRNMDEGR